MLIEGIAEFPQLKKISTKATINDVQSFATVVLLYPPDHQTNANETIATGLSGANGSFSVTPDSSFNPAVGDIYVLEATKRIGNVGNAVMSIRTYMRWNGTGWDSITNPGIRISKNTTALTIIDARDSSISANDLIGSMVNNTVSSVGTVSVPTINLVAGMVEFLLTADVDPTRFIDYQNNKYFISREISLPREYLLANNECPDCSLPRVDLSGINLTNANLTNANLSNSNLGSANLSGVNLTGANLTGSNIANTNFTGATWTNGTTICYTGSIGICIFPDVLVNTYTASQQESPAVAMDTDGDFVITWNSYGQDGSISGVYAQRYASNGNAIGSEFQVNTYTTNSQSNPSVAMDADGDFVVTWHSSGQDGSSFGIYAQRYTSTGSPDGSEFQVNTYTTNDQGQPSVAMDDAGDFVIVWQSNGQDGSSDGIYAQLYSSTGSVVGSEFLVNTVTTGSQFLPSVAMDADGDFVVTYGSKLCLVGFCYGGGDKPNVYAQRYTSSGTPVGVEFQVSNNTTGRDSFQQVAMDAGGDFVISSSTPRFTGPGSFDDSEIYAKRYSSNGSVQLSDFLVNTYITGTQRSRSIAMDDSGNFAINWESRHEYSSGFWGSYGIYFKRYNSTGQSQ